MFSYEDRKRAVKLYIQYDRLAAAMIREIGYLSLKFFIDGFKNINILEFFTEISLVSPENEH